MLFCFIKFNNQTFLQKMKLYNQCLAFTLLNDGYETVDLPQTIQDDIAVLQCFKNQLLEWNELSKVYWQIHNKIVDECYIRYCHCSIDMDCECEPYNDYEIADEEEWARLTKEKDDIKKKLDELEGDMKQGVPSRLQLVALQILKNIDYPALSWLNMNFND